MLRIGNEVSGTSGELGLVDGTVIQPVWEDKAGSGSGLHCSYSGKLTLVQSWNRKLQESMVDTSGEQNKTCEADPQEERSVRVRD